MRRLIVFRCTLVVLSLLGPVALTSPTVSLGSAACPVATRAPYLPADEVAPVYGYRTVRDYPHDSSAFTEGLVYADGILYESTGLNGKSSLRQVDLETGKILHGKKLDSKYFGEGIAIVDNRIFQLTWQTGIAFVSDRHTLEPLTTFKYLTEGWGLTTNGDQLIMSDGTNRIFFRNSETFEAEKRVAVCDGNHPVTNLNELEYIDGEIWANVWQSDRIARIDPETGRVTGWVDLSGLLPAAEREAPPVDVLNGIAYDAETDRIFVTGKYWTKLFEIEVTAPR